jgi:hypothetical protein
MREKISSFDDLSIVERARLSAKLNKPITRKENSMPKFVLIFGLIGVIAACLFLSPIGGVIGPRLFGGGKQYSNPNPQSAYVPQPGDCIVLPQGQDAVYDLYYAEKVNPANCKAFVDQSQARLLDAQAMAIIDNEIKDDNQIQLGALLGMIGGIVLVVFILWVVFKIAGG